MLCTVFSGDFVTAIKENYYCYGRIRVGDQYNVAINCLKAAIILILPGCGTDIKSFMVH